MGYYSNYGATCKTCKFFALDVTTFGRAMGSGECMTSSGTPVNSKTMACPHYQKDKEWEGEE